MKQSQKSFCLIVTNWSKALHRVRLLFLLLGLSLIITRCDKSGGNDPDDDPGGNPGGETFTWPTQPALPVVDGEASFNSSGVTHSSDCINVMADAMPRMPNFPSVTAKGGKVRGFVANLKGEPLKDASLTLRTGGSLGLFATTVTDANGYYEMEAIEGATFFEAGYVISYGQNNQALAGVTLYPVGGNSIITASQKTSGIVKNFVLLSYGLANEAQRASDPCKSGGYHGGSLYFTYVGGDTWNSASLPRGGVIEITLIPKQGKTMYGENKTFIIRRTIEFNGNFTVNNIPIGEYEVKARLVDNNRPLRMKHTGPYSDPTQYINQGLIPKDVVGTSSVFFMPISVEARPVPANFGYWIPVQITLTPAP